MDKRPQLSHQENLNTGQPQCSWSNIRHGIECQASTNEVYHFKYSNVGAYIQAQISMHLDTLIFGKIKY